MNTRIVITWVLAATAIFCPLTETMHACHGGESLHPCDNHSACHKAKHCHHEGHQDGHQDGDHQTPAPAHQDSDCNHACFCSGAVLSLSSSSTINQRLELLARMPQPLSGKVDFSSDEVRGPTDDSLYHGSNYPPLICGIVIRSLISSLLL